MPRMPRYAAPGQPQHVIQRGNNRTPIFADARDYLVFSEQVLESVRRHACEIHAYVLMTNHVHLLVTPDGPDGVTRLMQSVGRRYVRYFNREHQRTGTLWEGRYRATLIESERYLLTCYRYIELNPVRAGLVRHPGEYRWSSHGANAAGIFDPLVTPHARYLDLARDARSRCRTYRELFRQAIDPETLGAIRHATNAEWALGSDDFRREVGDALKRRAAPLTRGRPRRDATNRAKFVSDPNLWSE